MRNDIKRASSLLCQALTERFYGDGSPNWPTEQKQTVAVRLREKAAKLLRHKLGEKHVLFEKLSFCGPKERCLSGACPECNRALQRWFVHSGSSLTKTSGLFVASWIAYLRPGDQLSTASLKTLGERAKYRLKKAGVEFAIGGFDFSFNTKQNDRPDHWALHFWLITDKRITSASLGLERDPSIKRPVICVPYDGRLNALGYALKNEFVRRVSIVKKNKKGRSSKNTTKRKLRVNERLELLPFLDREGLDRRLLLNGARTTKTIVGVKLRRLTETVRTVKEDD